MLKGIFYGSTVFNADKNYALIISAAKASMFINSLHGRVACKLMDSMTRLVTYHYIVDIYSR